MNEQTIRQIARQEIERWSDTAQYGVKKVPYHVHNNLDAPRLNFTGLADTPTSYTGNAGSMLLVNSTATALQLFDGYFCVAKDTNGTTNVNVFSASGAPFAFTITGVFLISKDTTAGNITVLQGSNTVCTIAKGTTAGVMVGATSLSNTVYAVGDACQVDSDSAGNATVFIVFKT